MIYERDRQSLTLRICPYYFLLTDLLLSQRSRSRSHTHPRTLCSSPRESSLTSSILSWSNVSQRVNGKKASTNVSASYRKDLRSRRLIIRSPGSSPTIQTLVLFLGCLTSLIRP